MKKHVPGRRNSKGQSVVIMLILCLLSGLWLAGLFGALLPSYRRVGVATANNLVRNGAECGLDWAVDQLSNAATRSSIDVPIQGGQPSGPNPRVTNVPTNVLPAGVSSATVSVLAMNCPNTASCYDQSLDNAVQANGISGPAWRVVRVSATLANGNTKAVQAVLAPSMATSQTPQPNQNNPFNYALASLTDITGNKPSTPVKTYSFDSNAGGNPQTSKQTVNGDIGANRSINLGNMNVGGNVRSFGQSAYNITGSNARIEQTAIATGTVMDAQVGTGGGNSVKINVLNSTNAANPIQHNVLSDPIPTLIVPDHAGAANLPSSGTVNAGNYKVNSLTNQNITVGSGPVNIFVEGSSAKIEFTGKITVSSGHPGDVRIWYSGNQDVHLDNGKSLTAIVYAPNALVHFDNGGKLYGSVVGKSIVLDNGSEFFWDKQLSNLQLPTNSPSMVTTASVGTYRTISYQEF